MGITSLIRSRLPAGKRGITNGRSDQELSRNTATDRNGWHVGTARAKNPRGTNGPIAFADVPTIYIHTFEKNEMSWPVDRARDVPLSV